jgi:16S rRNA (guanine527-N7)-methyltransferase
MDIILKYFPGLTGSQHELIRALEPVYSEWNSKINIISRKDFSHFYERHVLHSLAIGKIISFREGTSILDVGTGGGFPGIPLAVLFPDVSFHLIDSIGKKIRVVKAVVDELGLANVTAEQIRAEELEGKYDFVVSRAVTSLPLFMKWVQKNISAESNNALPNGVIYLKGGDLTGEFNAFGKRAFVQSISEYYDEEFFRTKKLVYIQL